MTDTASALSKLGLGINRSALAPVLTAETGANAAVDFPTQVLNLDVNSPDASSVGHGLNLYGS